MPIFNGMNNSDHFTSKYFARFLLFYCLIPAALSAQPQSPGLSIPSNPAAVNLLTGTGDAQTYIEKQLGIHNNHGIRVGGAITADVNDLFSGGIPNADRWAVNALGLLGLSIDMDKFVGLKDGLFDVEILQFNGQNTNAQAGTVQGYNSLPGAPPLNRFELYKLWYRQGFFQQKLFVRVGKTVPSMDFNNVIKPVPMEKGQPTIPAVSGLIFTPLFVNASMLGTMPGYYNSAYGVTFNFVPTRKWYFSYGAYDGNLAQGKQTGLTGPTFNGAYFHVAETGFSWFLGKNHNLPGDFALGLWRQTGLIQNGTLNEHGANGYYIFGTQRFWYKNPEINNSGISGYYQFGKTTSSVLNMPRYIGAGLTAFGLIPNRDNDSMGMGTAFSWLNQKIFTRRTELMFQAYYQAQLLKNLYLEPALSYIPTPGAQPNLNAAWAGTVRTIILF